VIPFLENVLRGRNVPRERLLEVAEHYYHFDGRSPINDQNRELVRELREALDVPVYWGNRNWHPLLEGTVRQMRDDGVRRAAAFATSAFGSYSGCRQYREDIERALAAAGQSTSGPMPKIDKLPPFSDHPRFIEAMTDRVKDAIAQLPHGRLVFTAHSVPVSMAESSPYVAQLERACAGVAAGVGRDEWRLVYQSRSGPPGQPWLEPDICDFLRANPVDTIIVPIGFLSDHMEVLYDLDTEARAVCDELGVRMDGGDASRDDSDDRGNDGKRSGWVSGGLLRAASAADSRFRKAGVKAGCRQAPQEPDWLPAQSRFTA
jgi:ferrochelatase